MKQELYLETRINPHLYVVEDDEVPFIGRLFSKEKREEARAARQERKQERRDDREERKATKKEERHLRRMEKIDARQAGRSDRTAQRQAAKVAGGGNALSDIIGAAAGIFGRGGDSGGDSGAGYYPEPTKSNTGLIIGIVAAAMVLAVVVIVVIKKKKKS